MAWVAGVGRTDLPARTQGQAERLLRGRCGLRLGPVRDGDEVKEQRVGEGDKHHEHIRT